MPWRIDQIPHILRILEPVANRNGFLVSVYGSVVRDLKGRDLDLIFVQKRTNVSPQYLLEDIVKETKGQLEISESSLFAELCALVKCPDGRILDIQIRLSKCAPKDALDLYEKTRSAAIKPGNSLELLGADYVAKDNRVVWKDGLDPKLHT